MSEKVKPSGLDRASAACEEVFRDIVFPSEPAGLYDPLRYMIGIGGKRLRPTLCLLSYSLCRQGGEEFPRPVRECAAALEVFHSFTLIHDDIMDRSPLRRGHDTVWKKWNEDTAILSGDVMLIEAYKRIAKAPERYAARALDLFSETAAKVCEGQQLDMDFENREDVLMDEYSKMIGLKTAVLIACCARMGALLAGAARREQDALQRYGYMLGMAFQIADDYLDAFGNEKVFGKPIGGDIVNAKKSWLTVRSFEKAGELTGELRSAFALPAASAQEQRLKIDSVKSLYLRLGVADDAKAEILRYNNLALSSLEGTSLSPEEIAVLDEFAERLVGRAK